MRKKGLRICLAGEAVGLSASGCLCLAKLNAENVKIADWVQRMPEYQRNLGFGLCFRSLRNVKGFLWNHKRVYRVYGELKLNVRIKLSGRLNRAKPESLTVSASIK